MNNIIEEVHKQNFERIKLNNIKVGDEFQKFAFPYAICKIVSIHSLYGWVVSSPSYIKQDLSNLNEFLKR